MSLPGSNPELMNDLRQLAGGQGWLVERAFMQASHPDHTLRLSEVAYYILDYRLREEQLNDELVQQLRQFRDEWEELLPEHSHFRPREPGAMETGTEEQRLPERG